MIDFTDYPLPWQVREGDFVWHVEDARGSWVCTTTTRDIALLIAASPDLFNAASTLFKSGSDINGWDSLEIAVAKARGEVK